VKERRGYHPYQGRWCAFVSWLLGAKMSHGVDVRHSDGVNYWWTCQRCGKGDSTL
jgi:hypothetical protein